MVSLLATFGVTAKELFEYNRDYFNFDNKQRLEREMLRMEMQVKRFDLFREDIRDLVELTTSKMEMYHMVGALCLEFCVLIYTEGAEIAWIAPAPPFAKALYAMALASAFVYILLAVWLSMHASVSAHSFGVRLLTRFVRLPIPGERQVNALNARLTDFEKQGANEMLRVPFMGNAQDWTHIRPNMPESKQESTCDGDDRFKPAVRLDGGELRTQDLLGTGEVGINDNDLTQAAMKLPGHHVQLFRRLQAKWQCYDTYARVCMSLGAYHLLAGISYYLCISTLRKYHSITCCYGVISIFMVFNMLLGILDVGRKMTLSIVLLQALGAAPVYIAAASLTSTMFAEAAEDHIYPYSFSPLCFFLVAGWHEGLLHLAWPSSDGMSLPRRFRTVLFIDVFAVADEALKSRPTGRGKKIKCRDSGACFSEEEVMAAEEALFAAEAGLRRWQAVPAGTIEARAQVHQIAMLQKQLLVSRKMLNGEAARLAGQIGDTEAIALLEVDTRAWADLSAEEQEEDPFANSLLGPFQHSAAENSTYYYDLEAREFLWHAEDDREVLTLEELHDLVTAAEQQVRAVLGGRPDYEETVEEEEHPHAEERHIRPETARNDTRISPYVPQRLPWKAVCWMTRTLEVAWLFLGIMFAWQQGLHGKHRLDKYVDAEERRLSPASDWNFEEVNVSSAALDLAASPLQPCLATAAGPGPRRGPDLLAEASAKWLVASDAPRDAVPLCAADGATGLSGQLAEQRCVMGAVSAQGLELWPFSHGRDSPDAITLRVEGAPWRLVAGAAMRCGDVSELLAGAVDGPIKEDAWCLLLAGWAGETLPVAVLPLQGLPGSLPKASAVISPIFDVGVSSTADSGSTAAVTALHLEAQRGRLWAALAGGKLKAWELLGDDPGSLGGWRPRLPADAASLADATAAPSDGLLEGGVGDRLVLLCEDPTEASLLIATRAPLGGKMRLLRSRVPRF